MQNRLKSYNPRHVYHEKGTATFSDEKCIILCMILNCALIKESKMPFGDIFFFVLSKNIPNDRSSGIYHGISQIGCNINLRSSYNSTSYLSSFNGDTRQIKSSWKTDKDIPSAKISRRAAATASYFCSVLVLLVSPQCISFESLFFFRLYEYAHLFSLFLSRLRVRSRTLQSTVQ